MFRRSWLLAIFASLLFCPSAWAVPITVQLRIEGSTSTIFEGPVTTDGHSLDGGDGTGPHPCDGTNLGANPAPGPTMTSALGDAPVQGGWRGSWSASFEDFLIDRIGAEPGTSTSYWGTVLNFQPTSRGGCQEQVAANDQVLFALGDVYSQPLLRVSGPATVAVGQPFAVSVVDGKNGMAVDGASVGGSVTDLSGHATLSFDSPGVKRLKAERAGAIRSNALDVCIAQAGVFDCSAFRSQPAGAGTLGKPARDARAPVGEISSPANGARYRHGPRLLKGKARDDQSGVSVVKLALRRHVRGENCRWWSGRRERFVGSNCRKTFFFAIGSDANWSYLLPRSLPPGRYVLDVKVFDRARNRDDKFARGRNRIVFRVVGGRDRSSRASRVHSAARVQVMVVGTRGPVADARDVRAAQSRLRASGRRCLVPASTPLAALARRLRVSHLGYHVRDFGRCSVRRADSSAQLFVDRIGADRNSGQDGWFYKVNDRASTAGAADPAGGPLRRGDRVLWFYCRFDSGAQSCQRSLRLTVVGSVPRVGEGLGVRVRSFDNDGRGRPENGVTVTLASATAVTGADGRALLTSRETGSFVLQASKAGTTPAFPLPVVVLASSL